MELDRELGGSYYLPGEQRTALLSIEQAAQLLATCQLAGYSCVPWSWHCGQG